MVEWLRETWHVHSRLFCVITSSKEEGMIVFTQAPCCYFNQVCQFQIRTYCLNKKINEQSLNNQTMFLIWSNKTRSFKLSSARAVVKIILDLFGTHVHRTERLTLTFLVQICVPLHPYIFVCVCVCVVPHLSLKSSRQRCRCTSPAVTRTCSPVSWINTSAHGSAWFSNLIPRTSFGISPTHTHTFVWTFQSIFCFVELSMWCSFVKRMKNGAA